jgi:hypothetical protein
MISGNNYFMVIIIQFIHPFNFVIYKKDESILCAFFPQVPQASEFFDCFPSVFPVLPVFTLVLLTLESFATLFSAYFFSVFDFIDAFGFDFDLSSLSILLKLTSASLFLVLLPLLSLLSFSSLFSNFFEDFLFSFSKFYVEIGRAWCRERV